MKLKQIFKKFRHLKTMDLEDTVKQRVANNLLVLLKGDTEVLTTPLADSFEDPYDFLNGWQEIVIDNIHLMNDPLIVLESSSLNKCGPRSRSVPWNERVESVNSSWTCQDDAHVPHFHKFEAPGYLIPISFKRAAGKMKLASSAGLPFICKKKKAIDELMADFGKYIARKDPCMLYTRTGENWKTRNIWGHPFADTLYEMMFYVPLMLYQRTLSWRAALVSPDAVAIKITEIIDYAISTNRIVYSIDFKGFDASVLYQYIICAFEYFARCFEPVFTSIIMEIAERVYTIGLLTPFGIKSGKHGVPSGDPFTNEIDSVVQAGIALLNAFICITKMIVQGDDGVYTMFPSEVAEFEATFAYAKLNIEKSKSIIAANYCYFCQYLYHSDYRDGKGIIMPIYPTYRAITRLMFPEKFTDFKSTGINAKDYYAIRSITILENCKNHPLHEKLVRYVVAAEKSKLEFTEQGLSQFLQIQNKGSMETALGENYQFGTNVGGIKGFKTYKIIRQIQSEEQPCVPTV